MITQAELEILRKPRVQEYIREKMGKWEVGDLYYNPEIRRSLTVSMMWWSPCIEALYIPDCISRDSERPERSLHGMIDWPIFWYEVTREGKYRMFKRSNKTAFADWIEAPRLALLKALEWQIEQEGHDERT